MILQPDRYACCYCYYYYVYVQVARFEDERVERLLALLEQCDAALLAEFYEALKTAGQHEIVDLLRLR